MHPEILQSLAAERTRDMRKRAKAAASSTAARRSRHGLPGAAVAARIGRLLAHHQ